MGTAIKASSSGVDEDVMIVQGAKPIIRSACHCEWKIHRISENVRDTADHPELLSDAIGSERLKFAVRFEGKKPPIKSPGKRQKTDEGGRIKFVVRAICREVVDLEVLDCTIQVLNCKELVDGVPVLVGDEEIRGMVYLSQLERYSDVSGTLTVRATIWVRNRPSLAYDLALVVHAARLQKFADVDDVHAENEYRMVEIRAPKTMPIASDEVDASGEHEMEYLSVKIPEGLLCSTSSVISAMLKNCSGGEECKSGIISVKDYPFPVVSLFVAYIKKGPSAVFISDNLAELAKMADKYDVGDLLVLCVALMLKSIDKSNVVDYYAVGYYVGINELKDACIVAMDSAAWSNQAAKEKFWSNFFDRCGKHVAAGAAADAIRRLKKSQ